LIGHNVWLRRVDFGHRFVCLDEGSSGAIAFVWVDWPAAIAALDAGRLPCSSSEDGLLRLAASLAEGVLVDLGEAVGGLDEHNLALLVAAIWRSSGRDETACSWRERP
jgi:hypothetical protein